MMRLNHANLPVADAAATSRFFAEHFGFAVEANLKDNFVLMRDGDGFVLNLTRRRADDPETYPRDFHLGFALADEAAVSAKHAELRAAGHEVGELQPLRRMGTATLTFYCQAPGSVLVEVGCSRAD